MNSRLASIVRLSNERKLVVAITVVSLAVLSEGPEAVALTVFGVGFKTHAEAVGLPSELHRFSETGPMEQRWDIPESYYGLSLATDGASLFVGEFAGAIERYNFHGGYLGEFADVSGLAGANARGQNLETDAAGSIYVNFGGQSSLPRTSFRLDASGSVAQSFSHPELVFPRGIDAAANGDVYILNNAGAGVGNRIFRFSANGAHVDDFAIPEVDNPSDIAINEANGELYVADGSGNAVHVYDISFGMPAYLDTLALPGHGSDVFVEPRSGRIFGSYFTVENKPVLHVRDVGFEVSRDGALVTHFVEDAPSQFQTVAGLVAVVPEPAGAVLVTIAAGLTWLRRRFAHALRRARGGTP